MNVPVSDSTRAASPEPAVASTSALTFSSVAMCCERAAGVRRLLA
jgi:hypothetical protein